MHSFVSPDPISIFLAYLPVALATLAGVLAIALSVASLVLDAPGRRSRRRGGEAPIAPAAAPEGAPAGAGAPA